MLKPGADSETIACIKTLMANITRRRFLRGLAGASGCAAATGVYTWQWEPHWLEIVERGLPVAHLPTGMEGVRLVQLSDLHIGPRVDDDYLLHTFERVKKLAPDIVVYTGDLTSYADDVFDHAAEVEVTRYMGNEILLGIVSKRADAGDGSVLRARSVAE